ncbi:MAG: hydroxymethylglutaryl-CoA lyase [Bacteroidetes bacterium]|nr:hydroxymethylglutaryl-CoA lyase [Bacteroidota bacterium]
MVSIVETPRDGFQGLSHPIDTKKKIEYINLLLKCGFHTVEVGSFVSPKVIPQMADTAEVIEGLDYANTKSKIAVLVATESGGRQAMTFQQIDQVFFPFSTSPSFLKKNINQSLDQAEHTIDQLQAMCVNNNKQLIVYLSMAFGEAYGDDWSIELLIDWVSRLIEKGLNIFPLSDILGEATPDIIYKVFRSLISKFPDVEFGLHLHSTDYQRMEKVDAAYKAGVRRFDTVINGLGGCPQTGKELVGNLPLQSFLSFCETNNIATAIDMNSLAKASEFPIVS